MIQLPNLFLVGSTERNVGKTEFCCRLLSRLSSAGTPVFGVKVTTVRDAQGCCPRGGDGCGVCSSLNAPFSIVAETNYDIPKDTSRMLRAGADKVLWLRVRIEHIREGIQALLQMIPKETAIVCESNTLRNFVTPGAFIVIRNSVSPQHKSRVDDVLQYADRLVNFSTYQWDFSPNQCQFSNGSWALELKATAAILAGGKSSRMGQNKSLLQIDNTPLIQLIAQQLTPWFAEVIVSTNTPELYQFLNLPCVADSVAAKGPLGGIVACLQTARHSPVFVVGCDMPDIDISYMRELYTLSKTHDAVIPIDHSGRHEPLFAFYSKTLIPAGEALLKQDGGPRIISIAEDHQACYPTMAQEVNRNLNTPSEFQDYLTRRKESRQN